MPIARYVYKRATQVPIVLPNGRREVVPASAEDSVEDVIRRTCVAESLAPPEPWSAPIRATVGDRIVDHGENVEQVGVSEQTPIVLKWPSGAVAPQRERPQRVFVGMPGERVVVCAVKR